MTTIFFQVFIQLIAVFEFARTSMGLRRHGVFIRRGASMSSENFEGWVAQFEKWASDEIGRIQTGTNLRHPSDHQSMFKYISLNSKMSWELLSETLQKSELIGSSAPNLNDPFELSPFIFDDLRASTVAAATRYSSLISKLNGTNRPLEEVFRDLEPFRKQARSFLSEVSENYRIIAFCERSDSGLLWSHYANSFQGACLHFLGKGFRSFEHTLGYVDYSKYRPTYPLSLALSLSSKPERPRIPVNATPLKRAESDKILFFTKAEDWSYEAEIRIVYNTERTSKIRFHPDSLISIITGPRMSPENRERLLRAVKESPYNHVAIREARLSKTTFSVEISQEVDERSA
jgi:hypothetical protein